MSQFFRSSSSSPPPPAVPTDFITDDGTAIPAANILNVNGVSSDEDNINGIMTRANPDLSDNLEVILTNRVTGSVTTIGAVNANVITFTAPSTEGQYDLVIRVVAWDSANLEGSTYDVDGAVKSDGVGGLATNGTPERDCDGDAVFNVNQIDVNISGSDIVVEVTGLAGRTIKWTGILTYTFGGA